MRNEGPSYRLDPRAQILFIDMGLDLRAILRRAELPEDLFARGPVNLTGNQVVLLWRALEDEADDPELPIRIAEAVTMESFDPALFAAMASPNLNVAAERIAVYKRLMGPIRLSVDVSAAGTSIQVGAQAEVTPPLTLLMSEALYWVALMRLATRHRVEPIRIAVPEPPTDQSAFVDYLGVEIDRGPTTSVIFSPADANRPFLMANDAMWEVFEPSLRKRLADVTADDSFAERVRGALLELLPSGDATLSAVGKRLAVSTRTLHRRLKAEDTTFGEVLNRTRESLARHYVVNDDMSVQQITFLLGYDEPSSFYRAFQGWTGQTPSEFRRGPTVAVPCWSCSSSTTRRPRRSFPSSPATS